MAELPASWGLSAVPRPDGKLDIVGKDDTGAHYRARTTSGNEVTDTDLAALRSADREVTTAKGFVDDLLASKSRAEQERESAFEDSLMEGAFPVVKAGLGVVSVGFTHVPEWRWRLAFGD